jgi:hypothetical protein
MGQIWQRKEGRRVGRLLLKKDYFDDDDDDDDDDDRITTLRTDH